MSADFWSFVVPVEQAEGEVVVRRLAPFETRGDVLGPDGTVLHRFAAGAAPIDVRAIGEACAGRAPADLGRAYVEASIDDLDAFLDLDFVMSSPYAAIVALDRALALPAGIALLRGGALGLISTRALIRLCDDLSNLTAPEGVNVVVSRLGRHLARSGTGKEDAWRIWEALGAGIETALERDHALLLIGTIAP